MSAFNQFGSKLEGTLAPLAQKMGNSKFAAVMSAGMMYLPISVGGAICSMLANFPLPQVTEFLTSVGLTPIFQGIADVTINMAAFYMAFALAYRYAKLEKQDGVVSGLFAAATLLALMPHTVGEGEAAVAALPSAYLGSKGIFVGMICGLLIGMLYTKLMKSGRLVIKLPDSVPEMVSQSLSPILVGVVIFGIVAAFQAIFGAISSVNLFDFVNDAIGAPLMSIGATPIAFILSFVLANLLFFVGIHPVSVLSAMAPVLLALLMGALEEISAGAPISNLSTLAVYAFSNFGGTGSTLPLVAIMFFLAKSERYKAFSKIALLPNIMNINEPVIFGMPVVMNPILFVPFVLTAVLCPTVALIAVKLGFITTLNPAVMMALPFTVPAPITALFVGGIPGLVVSCINAVLVGLLYYPFFRVLDKQALAQEQEEAAPAEA